MFEEVAFHWLFDAISGSLGGRCWTLLAMALCFFAGGVLLMVAFVSEWKVCACVFLQRHTPSS